MSGDVLPVGLFISGGGTTAARIVRECREGVLRGIARRALVVSSRTQAQSLQRVLDAGVDKHDIVVIRPRDFSDPQAFGEAIIRRCEKHDVHLIGQYGWMPSTPVNVIERFQGRMVNQHPGPLDPGRQDFGGQGMFGLRVHCARIYFARAVGHGFFTEATAQRVAPDYDRGPVIARWALPILRYPHQRDTACTLAARLLPLEHDMHLHVIGEFSREGWMSELVRNTCLVDPAFVPILEEAKRVAAVLYPHG